MSSIRRSSQQAPTKSKKNSATSVLPKWWLKWVFLTIAPSLAMAWYNYAEKERKIAWMVGSGFSYLLERLWLSWVHTSLQNILPKEFKIIKMTWVNFFLCFEWMNKSVAENKLDPWDYLIQILALQQSLGGLISLVCGSRFASLFHCTTCEQREVCRWDGMRVQNMNREAKNHSRIKERKGSWEILPRWSFSFYLENYFWIGESTLQT